MRDLLWLLVRSSLFGAAVTVTGCSRQAPTEEPPRTVLTTTVTTSSNTGVLDMAGEVRSRVESNIGFQVAGRITRREVDLGTSVRKGQMLAQVDTRDLDLAEDAAHAQLDAARSDLALAQADLKRVADLKQKGFASEAELDRRKVNVDAAQAHYEQAEAEADLRSNQRSYATLNAPADGVIVQILADMGQVVSPGEPVFRIAEAGPRDIEVVVPEDKLALIRAASATVSLWAAPQQHFEAHLREVSASADPLTRTFLARYAVTAPAAALQLRQSAIVHLFLPHMQAQMYLPTTALFEDHGNTMVWVYDAKDSAIHKRTVNYVGAEGTRVAVAGLHEGDVVVTAGVHVLVEGQHVKPISAASR